MGLFDILKNKNNNGNDAAPVSAAPAEASYTPPVCEEVTPTGGLLNLQKNQILNLSKAVPNLEKLRVAAGWDVAKRGHKTWDLDVVAYVMEGKKVLETVYYGEKVHKGIELDGDNLTGEGEGDDETISINLKLLNPRANRIVFGVVIYNAEYKNQSFDGVQNAFTRVIDDTNGRKEICKFNLTENGGNNTAVTTAELYKENGNWSFRTIGEYSKDSIESLRAKLR